MSEYTPGPWVYVSIPHALDDCPEYAINCYGQGYLATVDSSRAENTANARLIAAAPDLLDTLADALSALRYMEAVGIRPYGVGVDRVIHNATAAINKARGEG